MNTRQDPIHEDDLLDEGDIYVGDDGFLHEPNGNTIYCEGLAYAATRWEPAAYCESEATQIVDGEPYCDDHAAWQEGPDPDDERDRMLDLQWERDNEPIFGEDY